MLLVEKKRELKIDFKQFELFLIHASRLLNCSIQIKTLEGNIMVSGHGNPGEVICNNQGAGSEKCRAEFFDLFRQIEKSKNTVEQNCYDNIKIIGIPLKCNMDLVAVLVACKKSDQDNGSSNAIAFLEDMADRISSEIQGNFEVDNIAQELSEKYEELNLIYDLGKNLGKISTSRKAAQFINNQLQETFSSNISVVSIHGKDLHEISYSDSAGLPANINEETLIEKIDKLIIDGFRSHDISLPYIVFNDTYDTPELSAILKGPVKILASPIKSKKDVTGYLCIISIDQDKIFLTGEAMLMASLAEQMSIAITNVELYENMKDLLLNVIKTLVFSIEAKDTYTKGHSERVNILSMMVAEAMELSPQEKDALNWASILHDIGKIGVPERVLTKPGKLTREEFALIREHPEKGFNILMPIDQLGESLSGVRHHHEKMDGSGYPSGLKGQEIPLLARIIAIADTYDAMTSTRSYRTARSYEEAQTEIKRVKGTQLDPKIVEIFISCLNNSPHLK